MEIAAAWTDAVLGATAVGLGLACIWRRRGGSMLGGAGLVLVGLAAVVGSVRLSFVPAAEPVHELLIVLASAIGLPAVGVAMVTEVLRPEPARWVRIATLPVLVVPAFALIGVDTYRIGASALGMVMVIGVGALSVRRAPVTSLLAIAGAVAVMVAGLVIAGPGDWVGMSRKAWFHLAMTPALIGLAAGLWAGSGRDVSAA